MKVEVPGNDGKPHDLYICDYCGYETVLSGIGVFAGICPQNTHPFGRSHKFFDAPIPPFQRTSMLDDMNLVKIE